MALAVLWPSVGVGVNENTRGDSTPHLKIGSHSLWAHAAAVSACAPRGDTLLPHLINSSMSQRYQTTQLVVTQGLPTAAPLAYTLSRARLVSC